jgi:hypothetical protein
LFLALEGTFTCIFFTVLSTIMEPHWSWMMPWTRESIPWGWTNSHLPFSEGVGESLDSSPEQLAEMGEARHERTVERAYYNRRAQVERNMAADLEQFRAESNANTYAYRARNPEKFEASKKATRERAKSSQKWHCANCNVSSSDNHNFAVHNNSKAHKLQVDIAAGKAASSFLRSGHSSGEDSYGQSLRQVSMRPL